MWWFRCALGGESVFFALSAAETWSRRDLSAQRGRSSHFHRVLVPTYSYGQCTAVGRKRLATADWAVEGYCTPDEATVS